MRTVLLTWEIGGGFSHLFNLAPLAAQLHRRGHRVCAAVCHLARARRVLSPLGVECVQSPVKPGRLPNRIESLRTFAQVLHNVGYGDEEVLGSLGNAWRTIFEEIRPDLILFEHSPMALLAARTIPAKKVVVGNGFCCPPNCSPWPDLCPHLSEDSSRQQEDENRVLAIANCVVEGWGGQPLHRLSQLYQDVDATVLLTLPEFDAHPMRTDSRYFGIWPPPGGQAPPWPPGDGKRIYAYLQPFPDRLEVLSQLRQLDCPTLVSASRLGREREREFSTPKLCFVRSRLDMRRVARECDLAVLNGNHTTTLLMHLAGTPVLQLPLYLEHDMNAAATARLGAGRVVYSSAVSRVSPIASELLTDGKYAQAAGRFAEKHARLDPRKSLDVAMESLDRLLS